MEEKENVYQMENQPETGIEMLSSAGSECAVKEVSAVLGKFKDVNALARAYTSLQAEFTRRSQRLKELERETGKQDADKGEPREDGDKAAMVEKLRKNALSAREEGKKFSSFVAEIERSVVQNQEDGSLPEGGIPQAETVGEAVVTQQETEGAASVYFEENSSVAGSREAAALSADELYEKANRNEEVRLKIIGEYLSSLKKSGAPLMTGGAGTLAAPPLKARSVEEAGNMALHFFKRGNQA